MTEAQEKQLKELLSEMYQEAHEDGQSPYGYTPHFRTRQWLKEIKELLAK